MAAAPATSFDCPACGKRNQVRVLAPAAAQPPARATARAASAAIAGSGLTHRSRPASPAPVGAGPWKKVLVSLLAIGAVSTLIHPGTFATFNATTQNAGGIQTGVLVLDTNSNSHDCLSSGGLDPASGSTVSVTGANTATAITCNAAITTPITAGGQSFVVVKLRNVGNLQASQLFVGAASGGCTTAAAPTAATLVGSGATVNYQGSITNNLCTATQLLVAETTAAGTATSGYGCMWGVSSGSVTYGSTTLAGCGFDGAHLVDSATASQSFVKTCVAPFAANVCAPGGATTPATSIGAGSVRYFLLAARFPDPGNANNDWQGLTATFNFQFQLNQ